MNVQNDSTSKGLSKTILLQSSDFFAKQQQQQHPQLWQRRRPLRRPMRRQRQQHQRPQQRQQRQITNKLRKAAVAKKLSCWLKNIGWEKPRRCKKSEAEVKQKTLRSSLV